MYALIFNENHLHLLYMLFTSKNGITPLLYTHFKYNVYLCSL